MPAKFTSRAEVRLVADSPEKVLLVQLIGS
jgi:hypothetical protein